VLISVVLPKPDSPGSCEFVRTGEWETRRTDDHDGEMAASLGYNFVFLWTVSINAGILGIEAHLVGQVCDTDTISHWDRHFEDK
jgi:hypothetical protein